MPATKSRTVRVEDTIWKPFTERAKSFGLSNTTYLKLILLKVNKDPIEPSFIIGEPEIVDLPKDIQEDVNILATLAEKAISKRRVSHS